MRYFVMLVSALVLVACNKAETMVDKEQKADNVVTKTADKVDAAMAKAGVAADAVAGEQHVYKVACGCEHGGMCSNLIEVDGAFLPLRGDAAPGGMPFCGKKGLTAKVVGKKEGETFVATAFELITPPAAK